MNTALTSIFKQIKFFLGQLACVVCALTALTINVPVAAQNTQEPFPSKPIRIIVTFAPGGTADVLARAIAPGLSAELGQSVVVVNKAGANSIIGTQELARSAPDGYTMGVLISTHSINPYITKSLPYDSQKDVSALALMAIMPGLLTINPSVPANTVQELIALAKAKPGQLAYGTPGGVTSGQLSMEYLVKLAGVDITQVAYKGGGPAIADLLAGHIQMLINSPTSGLPYVETGKLRALATTGAKRPPALKDVPTLAESGFPGFETYEWYGLFFPVGVPKAIEEKMYKAVMKVLASPELVKRIADIGAEPSSFTPKQFADFVAKEDLAWGKLIKEIGKQPE
jgi:tripartite-type tricarboxylate transporter receptor subunit TctC